MNAVLMLAILFMASPALAAAPLNTMSLVDKSGTASTSYPLQFGRAFLAGEIPNYPQVMINGVAAPTQADVKNRHPDGSVKYAVIAVVPSIPANGTVAIAFRNQTSGNNTALTVAQISAAPYVDATIGLDGTTVSARAMLAAGKCRPWTQGQIAQTMLCADDSAAKAYDVGPIRPRFHLTFWPDLGRVAVRYVLENSLVGTMVDKQYSVTLTLGSVSGSTNTIIHPFASRWTKTAWQGAVPQAKININYNLPYLAATRYVPNMDPTTVVPEANIADDYTKWQTAPKGIYERGWWTKYMPTTGGRPDLGLMPDWNAKLLVAGGDWRLREIALTQADLAAAWGLHFREGRAGKKIDKAQSVDGVGLPLSVYAEPGVWMPNNNGLYGQGITATDSHTIVTNPAGYPTTAHEWVAEGPHLPSPFYIPYVLTGDPFYLEESQLWSAAIAFSIPGVPYTSRGPGAGIESQTRGNAWLLADRFNSYIATPDDQPTVRNFLFDMLGDAVALFEGRAGITGTAFKDTPMWLHGQGKSLGSDPLHFEGFQDNPPQSSQWQHYYLINSLGWATDRGLPTKPYRDWVGRMLTGQFAEPAYNRFNVSSYWIAVKDGASAWYPTWTALQTANIALGRMVTGTIDLGYYGYWARAASTFMVDQPDGQTAYDWLKTNLIIDPIIGGLQWNLVPTGAVVPPITPAATASLAADPASIEAGVSSTLTYSSTSATSCEGVGFTPVGLLGSVPVQPAATTSYSLTCTGPGGASPPADATVTVTTAPTPPPGIQVGANVKTLTIVNVKKTWNGKVVCSQPAGATGIVAAGPTGATPSWEVNFYHCVGYVPAAVLEVLPP